MTLPVMVLGAGGHAAVVVDALLECGMRLLGLVDPAPPAGRDAILGVRVLGDESVLERYSPQDLLLANGVGGAGGTTAGAEARRAVYERLAGRGFRFATVVHRFAYVARGANLADGAQVMAGAVVQPFAAVGLNTIVNTRASIDHDCVVGAHVHIAPGATLSGGVRVGDGAHVGVGATIKQGVAIGAGALVAAGAVVIHDVAAGARVMGVPASGAAR
jgi:UDP-perosamine 4-acetyltransferase